jgi:hypothetical protein
MPAYCIALKANSSCDAPSAAARSHSRGVQKWSHTTMRGCRDTCTACVGEREQDGAEEAEAGSDGCGSSGVATEVELTSRGRARPSMRFGLRRHRQGAHFPLT